MRVPTSFALKTMFVACMIHLLGVVAPPHAAPVETVLERSKFVGADVCAACHPGPAASWAASHHAASTTRPHASEMAGRFNGEAFVDGGRRVVFMRRADQLVIRDQDGARDAQSYKVRYRIGVYPLQQYVVETAAGRLQAFDVAWDARPKASGGQRWFVLKPAGDTVAGDPLHWTGRAFTWNGMCAPCHVTDLRKGYDLAADRFATSFSDGNVACEACHGAGATHVAWAAGGRREDDPRKGLDVPLWRMAGHWGPFDPESGIRHWVGPRRDAASFDMCSACHARSEIIAPTTAGQPLLASRVPALIEPHVFQADGQIEAEDFELVAFLQSRMYRAGVVCTDCHDAHSLTLKARGNDLCAQCHDATRFDAMRHTHHPDGSEGARCVACHMPTRTYMGVHVRHDHGFRIPRPDLTKTAGVPNACAACHAEKSADWAAAAIESWSGRKPPPHFAPAFAALWSEDADAEAKVLALAFDLEVAPVVRASALRLVKTDRLDPDRLAKSLADPDGLVRLAALDALQDADASAKRRLAWPLLNDSLLAVRIRAARLLGFLLPSLSGSDAVLLSARLDDWTRSQLADAEWPERHLNIGALAMEQRRYRAAEAAFLTALRLDPQFVPALLNLAEAQRGLGREAESLATLRKATEIAPEQPDAAYALALAQIRGQNLEAARETLQTALGEVPGDARLSYALALVLRRDGRLQEAVDVLRAALRAYPRDPDVAKSLLELDQPGK